MSDEVLEDLADAINYHASAISELNKILNEFLKCFVKLIYSLCMCYKSIF